MGFSGAIISALLLCDCAAGFPSITAHYAEEENEADLSLLESMSRHHPLHVTLCVVILRVWSSVRPVCNVVIYVSVIARHACGTCPWCN